MILAIESGQDSASIAVGTPEYHISVFIKSLRNSESLLQAVDYLLTARGNQIKKIAVSIGPGSYTGLRVGLATAQGLAIGMGLPLDGVSSFLGSLFASKTRSGEHHASVRLRPGEEVVCRFGVNNGGETISALDQPRIIPVQDGSRPAVITAEGILKASATIREYIPFADSQPHFTSLSPGQPVSLMYLKPVQAKTLLERGVG